MSEECGADCDCHCEDNHVVVGDRVYTNTDGGGGMSDHMKKLLAKKKARENSKIDNVGDFSITF